MTVLSPASLTSHRDGWDGPNTSSRSLAIDTLHGPDDPTGQRATSATFGICRRPVWRGPPGEGYATAVRLRVVGAGHRPDTLCSVAGSSRSCWDRCADFRRHVLDAGNAPSSARPSSRRPAAPGDRSSDVGAECGPSPACVLRARNGTRADCEARSDLAGGRRLLQGD